MSEWREWRLVKSGEWTEPWCRDGEILLLHFERYNFSKERLTSDHVWLERHRNGDFVIGFGGRGGSVDLTRSKNRNELESMLQDDETINKLTSWKPSQRGKK
jgi:hypothetical protein